MSARAGGEFVDSNVLVYAHDVTAGTKREIAKRLLERLWTEQRGCLSVQALQEFVVNATRKVPRPISVAEAQEVVTVLSDWRVHSPEAADVISALERQVRLGISFWDAMIVESAVCLQCDVMWSEDLNPGQLYDGVEVRNPFRKGKIGSGR